MPNAVLTPTQREAVEHRGDAAIVASPGSGKTLLLIEKVAFLLAQREAELSQILLITFTEKAAQELKDRLARRLTTDSSSPETPFIGTIHSFLASLLRRYSTVAGIDKTFEVLEEPLAALQRLKTARGVITHRLKERDASTVAFVRHLGLTGSIRASADLLAKEVVPQGAYGSILETIRSEYTAMKRLRNRLDFPEIEKLGIGLLKNPEIRGEVQGLYRWILIDEFQDTSPAQWEMAKLLHEPGTNRLVIVGDPYQSIYRFRGARPELFDKALHRTESVGGRIFRLDENFRSRPSLIDFFNKVTPRLFSGIPRRLVATRADDDFPGVRVLPLPEVKRIEDQRTAEAEAAALMIRKLTETGVAYPNIALLFRARLAMPHYEQALSAAGIPYTTLGGEPLFERPEVLSILLLWRSWVSPEDPIASLGLGFAKIKAPVERPSMEPPVTSWIKDFFMTILSSFPEERSIQRNIQAFEKLVEGLVSLGIDSLADLLESVEYLRRDEARIPCPDPADGTPGVRLMTVHSAKGLQFPVVFLCDLGMRPRAPSRPYLLHPEKGLLFKERDPESLGLREDWIKSEDYEEAEKSERTADREESKRLLYVALTRTEETIFLSLPEGEGKGGDSWEDCLKETVYSA